MSTPLRVVDVKYFGNRIVDLLTLPRMRVRKDKTILLTSSQHSSLISLYESTKKIVTKLFKLSLPKYMDKNAFSQTYKTYATEIYRFCVHKTGNKEDAEDLVSRAFTCTFRPSRKFAVIGVSMIDPSGLAIRPRIPAN